MLQKATLQFLRLLNDNNNKQWFDDNRDKYLASKEDFEIFITGVLSANTAIIPELEGRKAKDCIFRIFKDVRFSKDKVPYKNNFGASFGKGEKKINVAGFYIHVQPSNNNFVGGGIWMPEAEMLKKIRQEIDYNFDEFLKIINKPSFKKMFGQLSQEEKLKKCPKEYTDDNPALEFLKLKSFTVSTRIADKEITSPNAISQIAAIVKEMKPFVDFLNRSIS